MPYIIRRRYGWWELRKRHGGKLIGRHKTRHEAVQQLRAIEASEHQDDEPGQRDKGRRIRRWF